MKKLLFTAGIAFFAFCSSAQLKMPQASTTQTIKQEFGLGSIEITYSRPNVKGRKIFGDLIQYGKMWRTGANAPTQLKLNEPIEMGGKIIDTGKYVLYTVPGKDSWEIIINKGLTNWGIDGYKESEDVHRFTVPAKKMKSAVETLSLKFENVLAESCELQIAWQKSKVIVPITVNIKDKLRAQIEAALASDKKPYWQAAQFYREYDNNLPKALENVEQAFIAYPKGFWILLYKARIQKEMGDKVGAKITSDKSIELARAANNNDYIKLNENLQKELK